MTPVTVEVVILVTVTVDVSVAVRTCCGPMEAPLKKARTIRMRTVSPYRAFLTCDVALGNMGREAIRGIPQYMQKLTPGGSSLRHLEQTGIVATQPSHCHEPHDNLTFVIMFSVSRYPKSTAAEGLPASTTVRAATLDY